MSVCSKCPDSTIVFGYQGISGSCFQVVPISGTDDGALYVYTGSPSGSITGSSGIIIYGSGSDGLPHAIAATSSSDGWALKTDTELILSGDVVISNVKVFSVDGTSGSLVYGLATPNGTVFVTSSISSPVWITGSGVSVTSSCTAPVWATLASGCYTASIDSYSDLHVYDTRVSGSIITGSIIISGSVKANSDLVVSTSALISGSIVANTNATLASNTLLSQSVVAGFSASLDFDKLNLLYQMYPYQLGVDEGAYGNDASDSVIDVFGSTAITGSTICPWIFNTTNLTWHQVTLGTVTTSSIAVTPAIGTATASLVIRFNRSKKGYSSADDAYQVRVLNPEYDHATGPTTLITESNGAMGLPTSSDIQMSTYSRFVIQFSRMNGVTASLSATISTDATPSIVDYYPITEELYGSSLINGDAYIVRSDPFKATSIRLNYFKTNATNTCLVRYWLFD